MEDRRMAFSGIVDEVLTRYNYQQWKTLIKTYLRGQNLWDVVDTAYTFTPINAQRDAKALHIIQLSCGPDIFDQIKHFETAERAWNHLAALYASEFIAQPHIRPGLVSDNVSEHKALYGFVVKGDWKGASSYLREEPGAIFWASASGRTVLHVATMEGHLKIVKGLVNLGKKQLVEMQDEEGYTALALVACYSGDMNIAKCIVNGVGDVEVVAIPNNKGEIPLLLAADSGHQKITRFLFFKTPSDVLNQQSSRNRVLLLERCIKAHIFGKQKKHLHLFSIPSIFLLPHLNALLNLFDFDVALKMLNSYPQLPIESLPYGFGAFHELARMPSAYFNATDSESLQTIFYNFTSGTLIDLVGKLLESAIINTCELKGHNNQGNEVLEILRYYKDSVAKFNDSQLREASVYDAMLDAAKHGNVEFINAMRKANHDLLRAMDNYGRDIFSYAVLHRKHRVFQFMHTLSGNKDIINYNTDMFGNNLLHLAAQLGPFSDLNLRPGAALQMQREIQWFKAVQEVVHLKCREARNDEGKKPSEIFIEMHKELMKDGEKWIKETAQTFAIVGVLVITVMFAAVFTVPGGYHQETGVPIFINEKAFILFIIADIISLFAAIITVLLYVDIQTSRYAEIDFLERLPTKIMSGLGFLSVSLVSMMVAFCAALAIILQKSRMYQSLFVAVAVLVSIPFSLLLPSQLRLLVEIFQFMTLNPINGRQNSAPHGLIGRIVNNLIDNPITDAKIQHPMV